MYKIVEYHRVTTGSEVFENQYENSDEFRLRRSALHYVVDSLQSDYKEAGYATETRVGGIFCYKSEKTEKEVRKITEILIKVEKI